MNSNLELAKRMFPLLRCRTTGDGKRVYFDLKNSDEDFDPLGKHFPDVLAFVLKQGVLTGELLAVDVSSFDPDAGEYTWRHDGSVESIARVVHAAAIILIQRR